MLRLRFGDITEDCIVRIDSYFDIKKKREWFNNDNVKKIIKEIDKSEAIKDEYIESPVLGAISPRNLSTGCKAVILMEILDNPHVYGTKCGDNCANSILEIASRKDVTLTLHHALRFPDNFEAYLIESDKAIHSWEEFVHEFYGFRRKSG